MSTDAKVGFFGEKEKQREPDVPVELDRKEIPAADERTVSVSYTHLTLPTILRV